MKLCIGDLVKLKGDVVGLVSKINYRDSDGDICSNGTTYLGEGIDVSEVVQFAIIPQTVGANWAWYEPQDILASTTRSYSLKK